MGFDKKKLIFSIFCWNFFSFQSSLFFGETEKTDAERRRSENNEEMPIIISALLLMSL